MGRRSQPIRLLLLFCIFLSTAQSQTCYYPNGQVSTEDVPCSSDQVTHCCNKRSICLSNGYCMMAKMQPFTLSRSSCTDQEWGSSCPQQCHSLNDTPDGWIPIIYLGDNSEHDLYCCGNIIVNGSDVACKHGEEPFSLDTGTVMFKSAMLADTTQGSGSGGSNNNNNNINNNNGNNDTDNNNNNNINNNSCNNDSNNNNNNDVNNGTSATSGPSACPSVSQLSPSSSSNKVAVGVGVGVSLGVVAVAAVAWALWERRARMRQWHGKEPMPFGLGEKAAVSSSSRVPLQRSPAELGAESPRIVELASDRRF